jgi:hypothetical protein
MTHVTRKRCPEIDDEDDELAASYVHELEGLVRGVRRMKENDEGIDT